MKEEGNERKVEHLDDITRSSGQQVLIATIIYRSLKRVPVWMIASTNYRGRCIESDRDVFLLRNRLKGDSRFY